MQYKLKYICKKYGLDQTEAEVLTGISKCQICEVDLDWTGDKNKIPGCIDHDHKTGIVRGVLCSKCNSALGLLMDSDSLAYKAYKYLSKRKRLRSTRELFLRDYWRD